ncbi:DNA polymerase III subunit gamma and tau [Paramicrobacterium humi]|uniref:DNA polymerase III subunit gamma and tau n=1 Tax=Paramicrobacterium humi TaxID=640635 RepID=UPI0015A16C8C|nr:DNA polymerase III subunit gamma and tau [Microbacterium humi]
MVTALYRRYRPENFSEMIGQSQVTDPLRTALRSDRVNHAYLFSGPRGCGKTTSARILARCLNCAEGPTDTPCGVCPSCVELSRAGGGSLDVVEIDAASHNGVDDARDLRERAIFAPARDRYKIFILDEAHMVTPQGFNALLKIVEEPPPHVKFIFATTEPDKVIGTIRSRTHHYPFRLVPPAQMLEYTQKLCDEEGVTVEPGVLALVVRAGGGSPRDTLSLLDQLMAGSDGRTVGYERAVALLGYTHTALLDEAVEALGRNDAKAAFTAIDHVIQTGQDPRRFVDDLLERLRDLIVVAATQGAAASVLRGVPQDELDRMTSQSALFGQAQLSRIADIANTALTEMTGATSPKLHLELMVARMLVPAVDETERGALARVERLERRAGMPEAAATAIDSSIERQNAPAAPTPAPSTPAAPPSTSSAPAPQAATPSAPTPAAPAVDARPTPSPTPQPAPRPKPTGPVTLKLVRDTWPEILEKVAAAKRASWMLIMNSDVRDYADDVLTLVFPSPKDVDAFKKLNAGDGPSEHLRSAILEVLGVRVKYIAKVEGAPSGPPPAQQPTRTAPAPQPASAAPRTPRSEQRAAEPVDEGAPSDEPHRTDAASHPAPAREEPAIPDDWAPADDEPPYDPYDDAPPPADQPRAAEPRATNGQSPSTVGVRVGAAPASSGAARSPQSAPAPSAPEAPSGPVTGWDVVQIPADDPEDLTAENAAPSGGAAEAWAEPDDEQWASEPPADEYDDVPAESVPAAAVAAAPAAPTPAHTADAGAPSPQASAPAQVAAPTPHVAPAEPAPERPERQQRSRYGEAVVREVLRARFIEEQQYTPQQRFN